MHRNNRLWAAAATGLLVLSSQACRPSANAAHANGIDTTTNRVVTGTDNSAASASNRPGLTASTGGAPDTGTVRGAAVDGRNDSVMDGEIVQILMAANSIDSAGGAFAATRARSAAVRDFAARLARDHRANNRLAAPIARRLNPDNRPSGSGEVRAMHADALHDQHELMDDSGAAFDKAWIDHEVDAHQDLLEKLDRQLIPRARDAGLKSILAQARTAVNGHLETARRLKETLDR